MSFAFLKKDRIRQIIIGLTLVLVVILCIALNREHVSVRDPNYQWHTKEYLAAAASQKNDVNDIFDPDLKNLLAREPELPVSWIRKIYYPNQKSSHVDPTGKENSYASFIIVDGDIAWHYLLCYENKIFHGLIEQRFDAKEFDPKYDAVIREVNQKVREEMKHKNIKGLGSCYYFWDLKKKYLKAKGVKWKSPHDLNPSVCYD